MGAPAERAASARERRRESAPDPAATARAAGLRYVRDSTPGLGRRRSRRGFTYRTVDGSMLREPATRRRIAALAIPPAWSDVWICADPSGHLQATGRDARGRKQYRYHPRWRAMRDATKFQALRSFGESLPAIRQRVERDLQQPGLSRAKIVATVVRLLETTCIRIGNEEYLRDNGSFGLTTLRDRHVEISGARLRFRFRGKGGKPHDVTLADRRLARIVSACQEIPGHELFQYQDEDGEFRSVESADINAYLKEAAGADFTAKDVRTWMGSVHALVALAQSNGAERTVAANVIACVDRVAEHLANTRAVCRKFYIHPAILTAYEEGWLFEATGPLLAPPSRPGLAGPEEALLRLLAASEQRKRPP